MLTAHDYKYDLPVLKLVLPARPAYVGLLGSKRRGAAIKEFLKDGGRKKALLNQLHVPTGLDIGADSASEIALSILAETVAIKSGREKLAMPVLYSAYLLDDFRHPRNYGSIEVPDVSYEAFNPLCGDRIRNGIENRWRDR